MSEAYDIVGLIGSFVIAAALVPQIRKVYRTKSASDISYGFQLLFATGQAMIVTYGIGESLWPIYIPCSMEFTAGIILLIMKCYYDNKEKQQIDKSLHSFDPVMIVSPADKGLTSVMTPK